MMNIAAPTLTKPTYQTLAELATKKFAKLDRFWNKIDEDAKEIRISVEKVKNTFLMKVEIFHPEYLMVKSEDRDIRRLVNICYGDIKRRITKNSERRLDISKFKKKFGSFKNRVFRR